MHLLGGRQLSNTQIIFTQSEHPTQGRVAGLQLHSEGIVPSLDACGLILNKAVAPALSSTPSKIEFGVVAIDHVVLMTTDAEDCIRLFGRDLGMRLALDKTVEKWGGRNFLQ